METRPSKSTHKTYAYLDLEFLIQEAPSIFGERSNMGGVVSALTSGGAGMSVASSDEHHAHLIEKLRLDKGALNPVAKWRALNATWLTLLPTSRLVLEVYYTPRVCWPQGFDSCMGEELASVALAFPPDGDQTALREACLHAAKHEDLILKARERATILIREAHEDWDAARPKREFPQHVQNSLDEFQRRAS